MLPPAGEAATVFTPAGSKPFATRESHSQPTSELPTAVDVPAAWSCSGVYRKIRSVPCAAETASGKNTLLLSPTYMAPSSAFSGRLAPAGSRQVPVGPSGSRTYAGVRLVQNRARYV